jgi:hypothetical protein
MTAFTAIVLGLAIGFLVRERRKAYLVWLPIWGFVLLGQTVLLARTDDRVDGFTRSSRPPSSSRAWRVPGSPAVSATREHLLARRHRLRPRVR